VGVGRIVAEKMKCRKVLQILVVMPLAAEPGRWGRCTHYPRVESPVILMLQRLPENGVREDMGNIGSK